MIGRSVTEPGNEWSWLCTGDCRCRVVRRVRADPAAGDRVRRLGRDADRAARPRRGAPDRLPDLRAAGLVRGAPADRVRRVAREPPVGGPGRDRGGRDGPDPPSAGAWARSSPSRRRSRSGRFGRSGRRRPWPRSTRSTCCSSACCCTARSSGRRVAGPRDLVLGALLIGLSLGNHLLTVFAAPIVAAFVVWTGRRDAGGAAVARRCGRGRRPGRVVGLPLHPDRRQPGPSPPLQPPGDAGCRLVARQRAPVPRPVRLLRRERAADVHRRAAVALGVARRARVPPSSRSSGWWGSRCSSGGGRRSG